MRAEAQAHVDQINQAVALVRRFLDWDRALRRLHELNNRVEDPKLWDDPAAAQEVMRERRRLDEARRCCRREPCAMPSSPPQRSPCQAARGTPSTSGCDRRREQRSLTC